MARPQDVFRADTATRGASNTLPRTGRFGTLGSSQVQLLSGELAQWQALNRKATIGHSLRELRAAGNLENLRTLATGHPDRYRGKYPFLDTDLFKTLEGLAYEINRPGVEPDPETAAFFEESVTLIEAAQAADGYLNSFYQNPHTDAEPWSDLAWGHELYNLGHLIQAAVAANRQLGDRRLLDVAVRFADLAIENFGSERRPRGLWPSRNRNGTWSSCTGKPATGRTWTRRSCSSTAGVTARSSSGPSRRTISRTISPSGSFPRSRAMPYAWPTLRQGPRMSPWNRGIPGCWPSSSGCGTTWSPASCT